MAYGYEINGREFLFDTKMECLKSVRRTILKSKEDFIEIAIFRIPKGRHIINSRTGDLTMVAFNGMIGMTFHSHGVTTTPQYLPNGGKKSRNIKSDGTLGQIGWEDHRFL